MLKKRNTIIYIPYNVKGEKVLEYTVNMIKILEKRYDVVGELAEMWDIFSMINTKAVFLNWMEERLDREIKLKLIMYKAMGAKIIWVFHNRFPHEASKGSRYVINNMRWLADKADCIILHSRSSVRYIPDYMRNRHKSVYVPHIIYHEGVSRSHQDQLRDKYGINKKDFVFAMFGGIRRYKGYEKGIMAFDRLDIDDAKLVLAGWGTDVGYAKYLRDLSAHNESIILDLRYIPGITLNALIGISDVIVLPYTNKSSMNSGVMIQAFSNGKTVITPDICMARDFTGQGFFYGYKTDLEKAMLRAYKNGKEINKEMGKKACEYVHKYHNEAIVENALFSILESENKKPCPFIRSGRRKELEEKQE